MNQELKVIEQQTTAITPMTMLNMAVAQGADLDKLEKLMALQERYEKNEARKSYNIAFAEFKAEAVRIVKGTKVTAGPLAGKSYAELFSVVDALTPALSRHGLSASWKLTKDEKDWMEVTCYLRHIAGHEEAVSMGGPPDTGGAKSPLQARASTKSYLERYTLKAICGVAEGGEDNDGASSGFKHGETMDESELCDHLAAINAASDQKGIATAYLKAIQGASELKDQDAMDQLNAAKTAQLAKIKGAAK